MAIEKGNVAGNYLGPDYCGTAAGVLRSRNLAPRDSWPFVKDLPVGDPRFKLIWVREGSWRQIITEYITDF